MRRRIITKEELADKLDRVNWHKYSAEQLFRIFTVWRQISKEWSDMYAPDKFIPDRKK